MKKSRKSRAIRKAIAEGNSFEEILSQDKKLNYHDIFHAVAEVPTTYWVRKGVDWAATEQLQSSLAKEEKSGASGEC